MTTFVSTQDLARSGHRNRNAAAEYQWLIDGGETPARPAQRRNFKPAQYAEAQRMLEVRS